MQPLVSIIIPTYNRNFFFLPKAIRSALKQTYKNIEVIVVNDAGENAEEIVDSFDDNRVKYFENDVNRGLGATRNHGINKSSGDYLVFLDSDDRLYSFMVSEMIDYMTSQDSKIAYGNCIRAHQRKKLDGTYSVFHRDLPYNITYLDKPDLLKVMNINPVDGFMVHRDCFEKAGLFSETLKRYEDYQMWLRISEFYDLYHYPIPVSEFTWRVDATSMSSTPDNLFTTLLPEIYTLARTLPMQDRKWVVEEQNKVLIQRGLQPMEDN